MREFIKSLVVGAKRRWRQGVGRFFGVLGVIWLLTELSVFLIPAVRSEVLENSSAYLLSAVGLSFLFSLFRVYERRTANFFIPTTESRIEIKFGDLFSEDCNLLIGVNEFFDGELGDVVAKKSVHGQFIERYFDSSSAGFRRSVDEALRGKKFEIVERNILPHAKYEIGTTAVVKIGQRKAFLMAMAVSDLVTFKAKTSVPYVWQALVGALEAVRDHGNGDVLAMPLVGNGLSSLNIEPQHLLRLIVLSLVDFGRKQGLPKKIVVVVPEGCFEQLDIHEISRDWRKAL